MSVRFGDATMKEFEELLTHYPTKRAATLPTLRLAEREFGGLDPAIMKYVADLLGVSAAHVFGVVSFYIHFRKKSMGKHRLMVCSTLSCALRGSEDIFDRLASQLCLENGGTTGDGLFTLQKVECLGACDKAPVVSWNDDYKDFMTPDEMVKLVEEARRR